ncbi:MAG: HAMP domain-containing sensor histidine kinase, partial [Leifsonia sp.]
SRAGGESAVDVYDADGSAPLAAEDVPFARALRGEEFDDVVVWVGDPGGDRVALSLTARRLPGGGDDDDDAGAVLVSRDVTAELTAVRARDDLVASVSHELRTPLTSIMGFLDLTLDEDLPDAARANLLVAERNTNRLLDLVADILSASTRGSGALSITREQADLATIMNDSVASLTPAAAQRGITFDTSAVEPTEAAIDPFRMRQVVDNLVSNAIKYNRDDGEISVGVTEDEGQAWVIVRDNGIGVSSAELPHLFDRYFRSELVRRSSVHGSGLGLGISRDIVRLHGGELTLHSVVDEGTTVIVRIPKEAP